MYVLVVAVVVIAAILLILLVWWGKKPYVHKNVTQDQLGPYLKILLDSGFNGGFMIIDIPGNSRFIQYSKYLNKGARGIQFDFPLASWSRDHYPALKQALQDAEIEFKIEKVSGKEGEASEFLVVDLKKDLSKAADLARICLQDAFGLEPTVGLRIHFRNVDYKYRVIGT